MLTPTPSIASESSITFPSTVAVPADLSHYDHYIFRILCVCSCNYILSSLTSYFEIVIPATLESTSFEILYCFEADSSHPHNLNNTNHHTRYP